MFGREAQQVSRDGFRVGQDFVVGWRPVGHQSRDDLPGRRRRIDAQRRGETVGQPDGLAVDKSVISAMSNVSDSLAVISRATLSAPTPHWRRRSAEHSQGGRQAGPRHRARAPQRRRERRPHRLGRACREHCRSSPWPSAWSPDRVTRSPCQRPLAEVGQPRALTFGIRCIPPVVVHQVHVARVQIRVPAVNFKVAEPGARKVFEGRQRGRDRAGRSTRGGPPPRRSRLHEYLTDGAQTRFHLRRTPFVELDASAQWADSDDHALALDFVRVVHPAEMTQG